jgi:hypothetical protein
MSDSSTNRSTALSVVPGYLIAQDRWLLWRTVTVTDKKTREKRTTKWPFAYRNPRKPCDAHDPKNWVSYDTVAAALARAPGAWDGPGFDLGVIEALGEVIIGLDLDTCLGPHGALAPWATDFLTAMYSYSEVSPSGTGIKVFARIQFVDFPEACRLLQIIEGDKEQARTITFGERTNGQHAPGAQVFLGRRYFTVTGKHWAASPDDVTLLDLEQIARLAALFGPKPAAMRSRGRRGTTNRANDGVQGTLGGLEGEGDDDTPPDEAALDAKLKAELKGNPRLRARWEGGTEGLKDTSRSGRDMSAVGLLVTAGWSKSETYAALCRFKHGKVADEPARYFDMMWDGTAAKPPPAPSAEWEAAQAPEAQVEEAGRGGADHAPQPADATPPPPPPPQPPEDGGDEEGDDGDDGGDDDAGEDDDDSEGGAGAEDEAGEDEGEDAEDEDGPGPEWIAGPHEIDIADEDRPTITVAKSLLHRLTDDAEQAIIHSRIPVYHRGVLVRPAITEMDAADGGKTHIATLHPLTVPDMMDLFCRTAAWRTWGGERKGYVPEDPPLMVARILLGRVGQWRVPQVRGILSTPTIRRDGSLLDKPGYDEPSRYYLALPRDLHVPTINPTPDKSEALAAIRLLEALLVDFPFIDDGGASRSVGLSLLITAVIRAAMVVAPIHAAKAPTRGTGKSYLYDLAAAIIYGDRCPVIFAGKGPEELEKKLNGLLLQGTDLVNLDNLNTPLEGDLICQVATQALLDLRKLGKSDIYRTPNSALLGATGNNMAVHEDLNRRTLMAEMDRKMERPELHDFKGADPFQTVLRERGKYIAAALTVVLGYLASGADVTVTPLASYDSYTRFVREPLWWLGRADPAKTMDALHAADPIRNELTSVMAAWEAAVGLNKPITTATVMQNIDHPPMPERKDHPNLSNDQWHALQADTRAKWGEMGAAIDATAERGKATANGFGKWLGRHSKQIAGGRRFMSRTGHGGTLHWWLAG